jgi:hypothetical protein
LDVKIYEETEDEDPKTTSGSDKPQICAQDDDLFNCGEEPRIRPRRKRYSNALQTRTVRLEETPEECLQLACLKFIEEQGKIRALAATGWFQVLLGRAPLIEAALLDAIANELGQNNMQSFWTSQADINQDYETTFIHSYYQSVCKSQGVDFHKDLPITGIANSDAEKVADVASSLKLRVRQLLKSSIGLLKPKVARKQQVAVESYATTIK